MFLNIKISSALVALLFPFFAFAGAPKASGVAKALRGSSGEQADILEVNSGKQMLVSMRGVSGEWEGKTFVWEISRIPNSDDMEAFIMEKRGSKTQHVSLLVKRGDQWSLYTPEHKAKAIDLYYSPKDSKNLKVEEVLGRFKK